MAVGSPNLGQAVAKAQERAVGLDLQNLTECVRDTTPAALNTVAEKRARRDLLESLYDESAQADKAFERIIAGNELQGANFLPRGAMVARAVMRIVVRNAGGHVLGYGSGFLVGDGVLLTNNHVLPNSDVARSSEAEAFYEVGIAGDEVTAQRFAFEPQRLFHTSKDLDFTVVAIAPSPRSGGARLAEIGWLPLIGTSGKAMEGEWLTIIQHPRGERKQLCIRENQLLKRDTDVLWYSTDTLGGSSGSPVFNNDWLLVALHHSGVPETRGGKWQTIDGRDYDRARDDETKIKWIANEGIRVSRIVETLRTDNSIASHPMVVQLLDVGVADIRARLPILTQPGVVLPGLFDTRPHETRGGRDRTPRGNIQTSPTEANMGTRLINVTLAVDEDGSVSVRDQSAAESALLERGGRRRTDKNIIFAPVDPKNDWVGGYDPDFLSKKGKTDPKLRVNLPTVGDTSKIAPLLDAYGQKFSSQERAEGVLKYKGYSVVMNKERRFAFFSAANVDGGMRPSISGRDDDWMFDDRIARAHQVDNSFYKGTKVKVNRFDRGHLTRRDDMEWGSDPVDAVNRANGTCTWPNCAPQHESFNQERPDTILWQDLERYILEQTAAHEQFKVQVISGPVFGAADPEFRNIAYPLEYWKVVAAVTASGKLFATAYLLSQKETIDRIGIEVALEVPFGEFATYQVPIAKIEDLTGLKFTYGAAGKLSDVDPLAGRRPSRRRPRGAAEEAFGVESLALGSLEDIVLAQG